MDNSQIREQEPSISAEEFSDRSVMENPLMAEEAAASLSAAWDWGNLLDFSIDDDPATILSWESDDRIETQVSFAPSESETRAPGNEQTSSERVRKRDPRVTCENFLAGRVPCSCPELDEKEEEEGVGRKRVRTAGTLIRCQVPGCEADISELKGYHRRHRVCLRCANATSVVLDGQHKRYCQQCGKFHILPDFDEGKRSCRRKLERHNNRRRRKSIGSKSAAENEPQGSMLSDDVGCDGEVGKETLNGVSPAAESLCMTSQSIDTEPLLESEEGHGSPFRSAPSFQKVHSNSISSFTISGKNQMQGAKDHPKSVLSSSFCGNRSAYSSVCPTGRISFKLYDWNPAEFPRRLRHQIFQWLASMPVELEGYIRPGCTILTTFIAMPQFMWDKLSDGAASYIHDIVKSPESLLSGQGTMLIYLSNLVFQVLNDGTTLMNINTEVPVPKLHYVHPTFFEAGKPMEFVVCGSNLSQPKFRLLVSFDGKYLVCDSCLPIHHGKGRFCDGSTRESLLSSDHEILKICIPHTETKIYGPAFIEVENESGLSNFVPVLLGDAQMCSELQLIQQRFDKSFCSMSILTQHSNTDCIPDLCEVFTSRQLAISELLLDIAWLLKEPQLDKNTNLLTSIQIQRLNCLLGFLIQNECMAVLERIVLSHMIVIDSEVLCYPADKIYDADIRLFRKHVNQAREMLNRRLQSTKSMPNSAAQVLLPQSEISSNMLSTLLSTDQRKEMWKEDVLKLPTVSASQESDMAVPLINKEIIMNVNGWPQKACGRLFNGTNTRSRMPVLILAAVAVCFGMCLALSHPHKVADFAVTVRRCMFGTQKV